MKKVNLVYWDVENNFGDLLSPFIVDKILQGKYQIVHRNTCKSTWLQWLKVILKLILNYHKEDTIDFLKPYEKSLFAVGSILNYANKRSVVWGAGFMSSRDKYNGGIICALRGHLSNKKVVEQGGKECDVFGDPALLLPMFVPQSIKKIHNLGIIPHLTEYDFFKERYGDKYYVINLKNSNIENVIMEITSCEAVVSTSLHGIIVAHAYEIPAIWIRVGDINHAGDFKFHDYFSSVNIDFYRGFENYDEIIEDEVVRNELLKSNIALPNIDMPNLRQSLLNAFPFALL